MYTKITIAGLQISSYWTLFSLGLLLMMVINGIRRKQMGFSIGNAIVFTILLAFFSLVGAKLLYIIENFQYVLEHGLTLDGVSFFGSVAVLPAAMFLVCKVLKIPYGRFMDYSSISLMAMLAVLRCGCYLNGCCGGTVVSMPVQLMEAIGDVCILGCLLLTEWNFKGKGILYPCILLLYGGLRFVMEFFRDSPKTILHMSNAQWFAGISMLAGFFILRRFFRQYSLEQKRKRRQAIYKKKKR